MVEISSPKIDQRYCVGRGLIKRYTLRLVTEIAYPTFRFSNYVSFVAWTYQISKQTVPLNIFLTKLVVLLL